MSDSRAQMEDSSMQAVPLAGKQVAESGHVRASPLPDPGPRQRGFSLIEALVVVVLVGILVAIGITQLYGFWQRSRLDSAVTEMRGFLQGVPNQTRQDQPTMVVRPVWVRLDAAQRRITVASNGAFTDVLAEHRFPEFLGATADWVVAATAAGPWTLQCDFQGRTVHPVSGVMVGGNQEITLTHRDMLTGRLRPRIQYRIRIAPLWNVTVQREVL